MEERIETKINDYIESILEKDALSKEDYDVLSAHLYKIKSERDNKKRMEYMMNALVPST